MGSSLFFPIHQNVLWSFLISIGLIHWNEKVKEKKVWKRVLVIIASVCIASIGGIITFVDYYNAGILMVLVFYFFKDKKWWCYIGQLVCMWYINFEMLGGLSYEVNLFGQTHFIARQGFALLALIPIYSKIKTKIRRFRTLVFSPDFSFSFLFISNRLSMCMDILPRAVVEQDK